MLKEHWQTCNLSYNTIKSEYVYLKGELLDFLKEKKSRPGNS